MTNSHRETSLKADAFGVPAILFFVFSAQAPLTGVVGTAALAVALGNGAGVPASYLAVGVVLMLFAVGFTTITRHIDTHGGFAAVVRAGLSARAGGSGAGLALLSYCSVQAAMCALVGVTTSAAIARHGGPELPWWFVALVVIGVVWALGSRQVELGARVLAVLVSLEFALLLVFALAVLAQSGLGSVDLGGSFSLDAFFTGAPGIAIMFAIASMFGFESTAIFSKEARDPRRTVPRATYIAVVVISLFFAFEMLMLVTYYGTAAAQGAALDSLGSDPALFVLNPLVDVLGGWAATTAEVLLATSLLAGILAFHNMVTRYLHALGLDRTLPAGLARTNRHLAPWVASAAHTALSAGVVIAFAALQQNPMTTLFAWGSGVAIVSLVVLYVVSSVAIVAFFRSHRVETNRWTTLIAPGLSTALMLVVLGFLIANFDTLVGGSSATRALLLVLVPVVAAVGYALTSTPKVAPRVRPEQLEAV